MIRIKIGSVVSGYFKHSYMDTKHCYSIARMRITALFVYILPHPSIAPSMSFFYRSFYSPNLVSTALAFFFTVSLLFSTPLASSANTVAPFTAVAFFNPEVVKLIELSSHSQTVSRKRKAHRRAPLFEPDWFPCDAQPTPGDFKRNKTPFMNLSVSKLLVPSTLLINTARPAPVAKHAAWPSPEYRAEANACVYFFNSFVLDFSGKQCKPTSPAVNRATAPTAYRYLILSSLLWIIRNRLSVTVDLLLEYSFSTASITPLSRIAPCESEPNGSGVPLAFISYFFQQVFIAVHIFSIHAASG